MAKLVILSGVPGSGKSYFSNALREYNNYAHVYIVSSDNLRNLISGNQQNLTKDKLVWSMFYDLAKVYSKDPDGIVVLDSTNTMSKYRIATADEFKDYFDEINLVCFHLPTNIVTTQNVERNYPVPDYALDRMMKYYELPTEEEYKHFDHIYVIENHDFKEVISKI